MLSFSVSVFEVFSERCFLVPGVDFGALLELKMVQYPSRFGLLQQSSDMRLEPAGCSGLRAGPPQIAPKIFEKRVGNLARFRSSFFSEQI